jgi:hypothetical protein
MAALLHPIGNVRHLRLAIVVAALAIPLVSLPAPAAAQGGPPLLTDDPDTPGPGHWEINLASIVTKSRDARRIEAPLTDINYGVGRRIQLKFEIPWLIVREQRESIEMGTGNSTFGVKWRFLGQEGQRVAWSIYPQAEVNTSHEAAARGIVDAERQLILPTEVTIGAGAVEMNGEVGMKLVEHADREWIFGVSTEITVHRRFELLGEVHGEGSSPSQSEVIVNVGGRQKITPRLLLMAAAGTAVRGVPGERPRLLVYAGVQFNLPGQFQFSERVAPHP